MNKKFVTSIILCLTLIMTIALASCTKAPESLEDYVTLNEDAMSEINNVAQNSGLDVNISGNDITFTCDIKNFENVTEDVAKSEIMTNALSDGLTDAASTFQEICSDMEEQSNIEGVQLIVTYSYDGEEILTKTFNSTGIVD